MKKTVVLGSLAYDEFLHTDADTVSAISQDERSALTILPLNHIERRFGGNGGNIVSGMALLGEKPFLCSALGYDGERYLDRLRAMQLPVEGIEIFPDIPSTTVYFLIDQYHKEIAMFINEASKRRSFIKEILPTEIGILHVGPCLPPLAKDALFHASDNAILSIFDPGQDVYSYPKEDLEACMSRSAYSIFNAQESAFVLTQISKKVADKTFRITTLGKDGVSLNFNEGQEHILSCALKQQPTQTVGAGDAFRAGLLTGLGRNYSIQNATRLGCAMASATLSSGQAQMEKIDMHTLKDALQETYGNDVFEL